MISFICWISRARRPINGTAALYLFIRLSFLFLSSFSSTNRWEWSINFNISRTSNVRNLPILIQVFNIINLLSVLFWAILARCIQFRNICFASHIYNRRYHINLYMAMNYLLRLNFPKLFKPILNWKHIKEEQNIMKAPVVKRGRGRPRVIKQPRRAKENKQTRNWKTTGDSRKEMAKANS